MSAFSFATVALLSGTALADSSVYLTNNTSKPIKVKVSSTLSTKYWKRKATVIPAFSRKEVLETNRDKGVTNGKTFIFTTQVLPLDPENGNAQFPQSSQPFALRLKLRGSTVGSHMWQSTRSQQGTQDTWVDDRNKYSTSFNIKQARWNVTYWAESSNDGDTDDDVEYVIRENYPRPVGYGKRLPKQWKQAHLNVLSYNVYMRPTSLFVNGQIKRAKMIPPQLVGYDVVVFQEAFDDDARKILLQGMTKQGYKYHSKILGKDDGAKQDGGVVIVSRYPIVAQSQRLFGSVCSGWDCEADKGVNYVKINKKIAGTNNYFHVFGTHLNNGNWGVQKQQLKIMKGFIDGKKIHREQAVILAGDMNINRTNTAQYQHMLDELNAQYFTGARLKGHKYTHDGPLNDLGDGSQSYLDYVLVSKGHRSLSVGGSWAEVRIPRAHMEWRDLPHETPMWDLSDHYAVYGNLHFNDDLGFNPGYGDDTGFSKAPVRCKSDADCPADRKFCDKSGAGAPKPRMSVKPSSKPKTKRPGKFSKVVNKKRPLQVKTGICRIPPPR